MSAACRTADRRDFLGGLAAASVAALSTAPAAAQDDSDAILLDLGRQWQASREEMARLTELLYEAEDRAVVPPYPEAIYFQRSDLRLWYCSPEPEMVDGLPIGRKIYRTETSRNFLRLNMENAQSLERGDYDLAIIARATEVFEAFERWEQERDANVKRAGVPAAIAELERATRAGTEIRRQIVLTPARTIEGIILKAKLAHWCLSDGDDDSIDEILQATVEHDEFICQNAAEVSLVRDLLALAARQERS